MTTHLGRVLAVLAGRAVPFGKPGANSGIDKQPQRGPVRVEREGLFGDEQGDRRVHGGPEKAVHHYPHEHYARWRHEIGEREVLRYPGAFGENLHSEGVVEADLCLGDRLRIGGTLLEVSQSRQPCWKLNVRFGVPDMARRVQESRRTGWYYRVLQPGELQAGDAIELVERPWREWSLIRIAQVLYARDVDPDETRALLALPIVDSWRRRLERRLETQRIEDWRSRLEG